MKLISTVVLIVISLLLIPTFTFSQSPDLGAASSFVLFTSAGAFGNEGGSVLTGDIGTNVGALTGFPPGTVIGNIHVADMISAQAALDVPVAYSFLAGLPCDSALSTSLGNSQVLTSGIYCLGAASTLNGELVLDAQGDASAFFIFQIDGAFSTGTFSNITLINSASFANIYWQINGVFNLGDYSVFKGNALVNGAINLLEGSDIIGKALSQAGAINLHNNQVDIIDDLNFLPVELFSFKAICNNNDVELSWSSSSEINNDFYSVERSINNLNWQIIGTVTGARNSLSQKDYSFIDLNAKNEVSYYRLKQTDFDGKSKYFKILSVNNCNENLSEIAVSPNPSTGTINLLFHGDVSEINSIWVYSTIGKILFQSESYQSEINLTGNKDGIYLLMYNLNSRRVVKKIVIKNS